MRYLHCGQFSRFWLLFLVACVLPMLACNLGSNPPAPPTLTPVPFTGLAVPLVALNPLSGPPGVAITLTAAGFPANSQLNLFVSLLSAPSATPLTVLTASGGTVVFALQLPPQLNGTTLTDGTPLLFTLTPVSGGPSANALFWVQNASGGSSPQPTTDNGGPVTGVFITSPGIDAALSGTTVTVTGSAPGGAVTVQVQDTNNAVLGSATAYSQAAAGTLGVWQTTIAFAQPAAFGSGYIVAFAGGEQASIPVTFVGSGAQPAPITPIGAQP
ncbi:MAG: Gmad2 immunoglobulin-like domain-containing protein [Aggregatilineales bacterium]